MSQTQNGSHNGEAISILKPDERLKSRLDVVVSHFRSRFHRDPSFLVRVPGRVNLIGEHVDYCGYSVCPMAIEQDVLVAVCKSDDDSALRLTNVDDAKYPDYQHEDLREIREFRLNDHSLGPAWHKYFLCGLKSALEAIPEERIPRGILAAVWGNIPPNAGLSSSSALVSAALLSAVHASQRILPTSTQTLVETCRSALAKSGFLQPRSNVTSLPGLTKFLRLVGILKVSRDLLYPRNSRIYRMHGMSKEDMATISASAERYIGTQGGGMDQAIAFLGKAGSAKLIEFNPLRGYDVTLPDEAVFVIAHSLADHNKAATSDFNTRVLECRLAAQIIAKNHDIDWRSVQKLIDVQKQLKKSLEEMAEIVLTELREEPYTYEEVCQILGTTQEELKSISNVPQNAAGKLKLKQRTLHVFQEAGRVAAFRSVCECNDVSEDERLRQLGNLMSKSHASLQSLYECSHPRIDALVAAAMECGALGARLTGAGWGGCTVAITTADKVNEFVENLKEKFYHNDKNANGLDLSKFVFQTEPKQGAAIYCVD